MWGLGVDAVHGGRIRQPPISRIRACTLCPEAGKEVSPQRFRVCKSSRQVATAATTTVLQSPFRCLPVLRGAAWCPSPSGTGGKRENADGRVGCLLPNRSLLCWSLADVPTESGLRRAMANPFGYRTLDFCDTLWSPGGVLTPAGPPKLHLMIRR